MGRPGVSPQALLVLVLYAAAVGGWLRAAEAQWSGSCDTSSNSPTKADIMAAISSIDDNTDCCQHNFVGSKCTTQSSYGTASIAWCNTDGVTCAWCKDIVSNIRGLLLDSCTASFDDGVERVGGWLSMDGDSGWGHILLLRN